MVNLRIHVQTTGEGQSPQEASPILIPPNNEQILIRTLPEVTEHELVGVRQDDSGLHLLFNHVGMVNLDAVTAQNQGRILVILVDGHVIYAPIIDEEIPSGRLDIPRQIPAQVVQLLQDVAAKNVKQAART